MKIRASFLFLLWLLLPLALSAQNPVAIRLACDQAIRQPLPPGASSGQPVAWDLNTAAPAAFFRGDDVVFQLGFFQNGVLTTNWSKTTNILIQLFARQNSTNAPLMSTNFAVSGVNTNLTLTSWRNGLDTQSTNQHASIEFPPSDTSITLSNQSYQDYWLKITLATSDNPVKILTALEGLVHVMDGPVSTLAARILWPTATLVDSSDTVPGYLSGKIIAGPNMTSSVSNSGGNETLVLSSTGGIVTNAVGVFNVTNYGAIPDGHTDLTAQFSNAIAVASASPGSTLWIPPAGNGLAYVTGPLTIPTNSGIKNILGVLPTGTKFPAQLTNGATRLMLAANSTGPLLTIASNAQCDISGIFFDGNRTNQSVANPDIWIPLEDLTLNTRREMKIQGCTFWGASGDGVLIQRSEVYLQQCMIMANAGNGLHYTNGAQDDIVDYVGVGYSGTNGIQIDTGTGALRFTHFDSFGNIGNGLAEIGTNGGFGRNIFFRGQLQNNLANGLVLSGINSEQEFIGCDIMGANWPDNTHGYSNPNPSGTFSDIVISGDIYNTQQEFIGCNIGVVQGSPSGSLLPLYHLDDQRHGAQSNGMGIVIMGGLTSFSGTTSGKAWNPDGFVTNAVIFGLSYNGSLPPYMSVPYLNTPGNVGANGYYPYSANLLNLGDIVTVVESGINHGLVGIQNTNPAFHLHMGSSNAPYEDWAMVTTNGGIYSAVQNGLWSLNTLNPSGAYVAAIMQGSVSNANVTFPGNGTFQTLTLGGVPISSWGAGAWNGQISTGITNTGTQGITNAGPLTNAGTIYAPNITGSGGQQLQFSTSAFRLQDVTGNSLYSTPNADPTLNGIAFQDALGDIIYLTNGALNLGANTTIRGSGGTMTNSGMTNGAYGFSIGGVITASSINLGGVALATTNLLAYAGSAVLSGGVATVLNANAYSTNSFKLTYRKKGPTISIASVSNVVDGTSFKIVSEWASDTNQVDWDIEKPH